MPANTSRSIQGLLDRSLRLELATTYGPQISEELLAIRIGKDIQLVIWGLVVPQPTQGSIQDSWIDPREAELATTYGTPDL